jgi:hypothetical protein
MSKYKVTSGKKNRTTLAKFNKKRNAKKKVKVLQNKKERNGNGTPFNPRIAKAKR